MFKTNYSLFTDPLFSLESPSSSPDKKQTAGEFFDRQRKGVGVGEEEVIYFSFSRSAIALALVLADVFQKNEKKNKTTSVYRLN